MSEIITKSDIENWFKSARRLIYRLNQNIDNLNKIELSNIINDRETEYIRGFKIFIEQSIWASFSNITIDFCNFFKNPNSKECNKSTFQKLFNRLENQKYDDDLMKLLNSNKENNYCKYNNLFYDKKSIKHFIKRSRDDIEAKNETIIKLYKRRDEFIAHIDIGKEPEPESMNDIKSMWEMSKQLFQFLERGFFNFNDLYITNWKYDFLDIINSCKRYNKWKFQKSDYEKVKTKKVINTFGV